MPAWFEHFWKKIYYNEVKYLNSLNNPSSLKPENNSPGVLLTFSAGGKLCLFAQCLQLNFFIRRTSLQML